MSNLINGLTALGNGSSIAYLFVGSLLGMFLGVVPGLGGLVVLSLVLAFVYHISVSGTLSLFLATQAGSYFSSSVTAILLNTPAHPESFAVTFDGYPMAQRGEAGRALGLSAASTCIGGLVGCAALVGFYQIMNNLPSLFHPPEYVALVMLALILIGTIGSDSAGKALISAGLGLLIATIGPDSNTSTDRFTFHTAGLSTGISLVALALGVFAIPQMILVFGTGTSVARQDMLGNEVDATGPAELGQGFQKQVIGGVLEALSHWVTLLVSGIVGVVTGVIPGIGGFTANFLSYGIAQQTSKKHALFGTGIAEGIIAPEGSSLSKEAGGMVPLLGIGIPGGVGGALFLAALSIKDIRVGYNFTHTYPTIAYEIVWIIALGGLIGTVAGVLAAPLLARVTRVPGPALVPFIMALSVIGVFAADYSFFTVMEVLVFGVIGFILRRLRYSLGCFVIGLVLGSTLETNAFLTRTIYPGATCFERPLADVLFAIAIGVLVVKTVERRRERRRKKELRNERLLDSGSLASRIADKPYPVLSLIATSSIIAISLAFLIYGAIEYSFATALMPSITAGVAAAAALWQLPTEILDVVNLRRASAMAGSSAGELHSTQSTKPAEAFGEIGVATTAVGNDAVTETGRGLPRIREKAWGRSGQYSREVMALLWFVILVSACYLFGFTVGIPAFCFVYGLSATRTFLKSPISQVTFAILCAACMWAADFEVQSLLHLSFTPLVHV